MDILLYLEKDHLKTCLRDTALWAEDILENMELSGKRNNEVLINL